MGRGYIDLKGQRFSQLTVIEESKIKGHSGKKWDCACSCGEVVSVYGSDLRRGRCNYCKKCNKIKSKQSPLKSLFGNYRRNANNRGYVFELSLIEFEELIIQECYYCGDAPNQLMHKKGTKEGLYYNGIDRKDNKMGYTRQNCVTCCKFCNLAKNRFKIEQFLSWIKRIKNLSHD
jgi:hypothetical protein